MASDPGRPPRADASPCVITAVPSFALAIAAVVAIAAIGGCRSGPPSGATPKPVAIDLPSPGPASPDGRGEEGDGAIAAERLRLLVVREGRVAAVDPRGEDEREAVLTELGDRVRSVRTIEGGHAVLVVAGQPAPSGAEALWRAEAGLPMRLGEQPRVQGMLGSLSALDPAGRTVVLHDPGEATGVLKLLRLGSDASHAEPSPEDLVETRFHGGSDVSGDGTHVLVSGVPTSCTERSLARCPVYLWGMDLGADEPRLERLSDPRTRVAYHPHFEPTMAASYAFTYQTTAQDASRDCRDDLNRCRHDIVLRPWSGGQGSIVRKEALGPYVAPGNEARAHLSHESCEKLPCDQLTLVVEHDGEERVVARDVVLLDEHMWSPDGRWLAWVGSGQDGAERAVRVVDVAEGEVHTLGAGRPHAWIRLDG